jgi:hypothetical protein
LRPGWHAGSLESGSSTRPPDAPKIRIEQTIRTVKVEINVARIVLAVALVLEVATRTFGTF